MLAFEFGARQAAVWIGRKCFSRISLYNSDWLMILQPTKEKVGLMFDVVSKAQNSLTSPETL